MFLRKSRRNSFGLVLSRSRRSTMRCSFGETSNKNPIIDDDRPLAPFVKKLSVISPIAISTTLMGASALASIGNIGLIPYGVPILSPLVAILALVKLKNPNSLPKFWYGLTIVATSMYFHPFFHAPFSLSSLPVLCCIHSSSYYLGAYLYAVLRKETSFTQMGAIVSGCAMNFAVALGMFWFFGGIMPSDLLASNLRFCVPFFCLTLSCDLYRAMDKYALGSGSLMLHSLKFHETYAVFAGFWYFNSAISLLAIFVSIPETSGPVP
mmetsp:Transcript_42878/g.49288  ORF Transcript_42878/g.49288 Transcript_42878/m.49288 type:complete len:266 (-) Transcript_42878:176-973(-)